MPVSAPSSGGSEVTEVRARAYRVPTETPESDGTLAWSVTTIVVVEVRADDSTGLGYTYAHPACVEVIETVLASTVLGRDVLDVPAAWQAMRRAVRNDGRPGLVSCAMSAVEIALWDAAARLCGLALSRLLGRAHESVAVYGSGGFITYDDDQLRQQLERWVGDRTLSSVKIKVGEGRGSNPERDLARTAFAREVVGDGVRLFVDANGAYSAAQAVRVGRRLDGMGVVWFEEPVSSDDLSGLRRVLEATEADVTAGEYGFDLPYFATMLEARAVDCLQVDLTRCGGIGEWHRAAALAAARGIEISGHCAQNVTAHAAVATQNVRHLEWFRDHERIEVMLFDGVLEPTGGEVRPDPSVPGHGMTLKEADAEPYRVR
ncbi:enolase C-terminal domain-like protein [Actinopolyspora mortivallis]|uniref:Mandelate racemase n=1 Tax=Actinopolyspora mortivallis TaxID=33906 RepID=A0A2T0H246_ACTMO|nr:enolase C-terminal domain-like protein [Actinopolyspora mortivallis]PRW65441.1 mandelate racemase [Actinopolyspora mortivallis]